MSELDRLRIESDRVILSSKLAISIVRDFRLGEGEQMIPETIGLAPLVLRPLSGSDATREEVVAAVGPYEAFWFGFDRLSDADFRIRIRWSKNDQHPLKSAEAVTNTILASAASSLEAGDFNNKYQQLVPPHAIDRPSHALSAGKFTIEIFETEAVKSQRLFDPQEPLLQHGASRKDGQPTGAGTGPETNKEAIADEEEAWVRDAFALQVETIAPDEFQKIDVRALPADINDKPPSPAPKAHNPFAD